MPDNLTESALAATIALLNQIYSDAWAELERLELDALELPETPTNKERREQKQAIDKIIEAIVAILLIANTEAMHTINDSLPAIYTANYTMQGYSAAAPAGGLPSTYAMRVYRQETSRPYLKREVAEAIKRAMRAGKGVKGIARRVQRVTDYSRSRALTTARTEAFRVAAESRFDLGKAAQAAGFPIEKTWIHRNVGQKTFRDNHVAMTGETVPLDEPFSNGLLHPLEAGAPPEEVVNCRCRLEVHIAWYKWAKQNKDG